MGRKPKERSFAGDNRGVIAPIVPALPDIKKSPLIQEEKVLGIKRTAYVVEGKTIVVLGGQGASECIKFLPENIKEKARKMINDSPFMVSKEEYELAQAEKQKKAKRLC